MEVGDSVADDMRGAGRYAVALLIGDFVNQPAGPRFGCVRCGSWAHHRRRSGRRISRWPRSLLMGSW
jgi:hypothetical protein